MHQDVKLKTELRVEFTRPSDGMLEQGDGINQKVRNWADAGLVDMLMRELVIQVGPICNGSKPDMDKEIELDMDKDV